MAIITADSSAVTADSSRVSADGYLGPFTANVVELASASDTVTAGVTTSTSIAELATASDSSYSLYPALWYAKRSGGINAKQVDAQAINGYGIRGQSHEADVLESGAANSTQAATLAAVASITESATALDSQVMLFDFERLTVEAATADDASTCILLAAATVTEITTASDTIDASVYRVVHESAEAMDSYTVTVTRVLSPHTNDFADITDHPGGAAVTDHPLADSALVTHGGGSVLSDHADYGDFSAHGGGSGLSSHTRTIAPQANHTGIALGQRHAQSGGLSNHGASPITTRH